MWSKGRKGNPQHHAGSHCSTRLFVQSGQVGVIHKVSAVEYAGPLGRGRGLSQFSPLDRRTKLIMRNPLKAEQRVLGTKHGRRLRE